MLQMSQEVFLQLKRKQLYNEYMSETDFSSLNKQEKDFTIGLIEDLIAAELENAIDEYPPLIWFQVSKEQIAEDDEIFLRVSDAVIYAINKSKKDNKVYIIWAYQNNTLPYPTRLIYQEDVFVKYLRK